MPVIQDEVGLTLDRMVVATDFTPSSETATAYATALAKHFASTITLTHVIDLSVATRNEAAVVGFPLDQMRQDGAENMERAVESVRSAGVQVLTETTESRIPGKAIVDIATGIDADIVVMGTNGRHGLSRMILGSCAEGVIRHAKCPVITVGPNARPAPKGAISFHNIVFATDLKSHTAEKAAVALAFAEDSIATIYLCHVLRDTGKDYSDAIDLELHTETALRKLIPDSALSWCNPEEEVGFGSVSEYILSVAKRVRADLIVLGAHRSATWFSRLTDGVVPHVLARAECPVMTICTD